MKTFADYCTPARIYLGISFVALVIIVIQNVLNSNQNELCVGVYKCTMSHKLLVLVFKVIYMLFWAWLLNFLCKKGLKNLAWFILLLPFLLIAVIIGGMILVINHNDTKNTHENNKHLEQQHN